MATIIIPNFTTEKSVVGLNTYQYTIQTAGVHNCKIKVDHRETSAMTISITQAGSINTTLSTMTLTPTTNNAGLPQTTAILSAPANCVIGDVISFILTSSAAIDQQLNTTKAILNVHVGALN